MPEGSSIPPVLQLAPTVPRGNEGKLSKARRGAMTEPENFYEAPAAPLIANSIVVHQPFISFVSGSICWGGAIFGLGITFIFVITDINLRLSKGWQEVFLADYGL